MQLQSFETSTSGERKKCRGIYCLLGSIILLLTVGLILAIIFAVIANKKCPEQILSKTDACESNPIVWQDVACCRESCKKNWNPLPLLLISMDGFRYDYLTRNKTGALKRIIECGVHAPFMFPSYPTKTFPNHYSIITGLYPESHGIIDNAMYDPNVFPEEDQIFRLNSRNPQWWFGEPLWNTVTKNGLKAATFGWPGSEIKIQDMTHAYTLPYNKSVEFYARVDQIIRWLLLPDNERPSFLTMYLEQPDADGHNFGPESPQVDSALMMVDAQINYLFTRLFEEDLLSCLNVVILADHGMQEIVDLITLDNYIETDNLAIFGGPVGRIVLNGSKLTANEIRSKLTCRSNKYRVFLREEMPKRMHYSRNSRIGDVVLDSNVGVEILPSFPWVISKGDHGYDNLVRSMRALFVAWGPSYKINYTINPFQNVELYNFFVDTLNLQSRAPNNGTLGTLDEIFANPIRRDYATRNKIESCVLNSFSCGTCKEEMTSCGNMWSNNATVVSPTLQQQCLGLICNTTILYNHDYHLPAAAVNLITNAASRTAARPVSVIKNSCIKSHYAEIDCKVANLISGKLRTLKMEMYQLVASSDVSKNYVWDLQAPMFDGFYVDVWKNLENFAIDYAQRFGHIIVISGPIFDYDFDGIMDGLLVTQNGSFKKHGLREILIPTHYYQIFLRCSGQWIFPLTDPVQSCNGDVEPLPFIVQNSAAIGNCMNVSDYLRMNLARIRDVELLTGIEFFPINSPGEIAQKTILIRTKISDELW